MPAASRLFVVVCLLTGAVGASEPVADWPQWRGPNRDNKSSFQGLNTDWAAHPPQLLWQVEGVGAGYASVSTQGDLLLTTGNLDNGQNVIAIDLKEHRIVWKQPITEKNPQHGYEGARCTPTIDGDRVYAVASSGAIACLNLHDGKVLWRREFSEWKGRMMSGWGFSESPLIDGPAVLCTPGGPEAMIVCLNKENGQELWKSAVAGGEGKNGAGYSSIVISEAAGVKQYVQLVGQGLIGVRASDGKHLWSYGRISNPTANIPTPIPAGDYIFGSTGYGGGGSALLKLVRDNDGVKAEEVYYYGSKDLQNHHGGMVLDGDYLYFGHGHNKGFPVCVELKTGKILWDARKESRDLGSDSAAITWVDGHLIFRYQNGPVVLIEANPAGFKAKGVLAPAVNEREAWAHPVVVAGKLFIRSQNTLMCYDVSATK